ncbi:MAG: ExbD/TolR family protein [Bdellovibrionales bacterium]
MPIHPPGKRNRRNKKTSSGSGRKVVASLSLTAMVDMFTVLAIFLLQNYNATGQAIHIPKEVTLPKAASIKELKPSHVVTISRKDLMLDDVVIGRYEDVKNSKDWMIPQIYQRLAPMLKAEKDPQRGFRNTLQKAVKGREKVIDENQIGKVTVQADKDIDFLTIKKIMYSVTESGAIEINFAVTKKAQEQPGTTTN